MVDKHQTFQDTRCFFVVSTDGSRSDFSYLKCMENFVRKNYTEDVDTFCMKYLRPRRRQAPAADGGTAPGTSAEVPQSTTAETEQGTPALPETQVGTPAPPETQVETPAPPDAIPQETLETPEPDSTADAGILGKGPDPTPAAAPQETHRAMLGFLGRDLI
uniref:Uncharacterized protein n=1 Tax=Arundo donax TaxID=35708 RepID=A0A0A9CV57_ARUDO